MQFSDVESYRQQEQELFTVLADSDGDDDVVIFLKNTRAFKVLPKNLCVKADEALHNKLKEAFGAENIKFLPKSIENPQKMN